MKKTIIYLTAAVIFSFCLVQTAQADELSELKEQLKAMQKQMQEQAKQIEGMKEKIEQLEAERQARIETPKEMEERVIALEKEQKELKDRELPLLKGERFKIGGAISLNYFYKDFDDANKDKGGDMEFSSFRLGVHGSINDILISAQYRWYSYMHVIQNAWIGYNFTDNLQTQLGITRVPFGILPYASHNYWEGVPYYLGFEDDRDLGLKLLYKKSPWDLRVAFFKNAEWGSPSKTERYSYDVVKVGDQNNEEINQLNARLAYTFEHGKLGSTEAGLSGQFGQLYNSITESSGHHWAVAGHVNGYYGPFNLMLEAVRYQHNPKNPAGIDDKTVVMGGFDGSYEVAAEGTILVADLSYNVPVKWGPISKLTFYDDYSVLIKDEDNFNDSYINTLGCVISAEPVFIYLDKIGRAHV